MGLTVTHGGASDISFYQKNQDVQLRVDATDDGSALIFSQDKKPVAMLVGTSDFRGLNLADSTGNFVETLAVAKDAPGVELYDSRERRAALYVSKGVPSLALFHGNGAVGAILGIEPSAGPTFYLRDDANKVLFSAPH
jgi:hypothetical protein